MVYRRDDQIFGGGIGWMGQTALPAPKVLGLEWQGPITLAVSTTGNDTNLTRPARIVSGDWSAKPFATIQAAINALPLLARRRLASTVTDTIINVEAGTFPGFQIIGSNLALTVRGARVLATLASGVNTGTATGGGARTLTMTGAGWTVDDLRGRYVNVTAGPGAGQVCLVAKNTTDTITFAGEPYPALGVGSVFTIEDLATFLNTLAVGGASSIVRLQACSGYVRLENLATTLNPTATGFSINLCPGTVSCYRCATLGQFVGFSVASGGILWTTACYADGNSYAGFSCQNVIMLAPYNCLAYNCAIGFLYSRGISWLYLGGGSGNVALNCVTALYVVEVKGSVDHLVTENCTYGLQAWRSQLEIYDWELIGCTGFTMGLKQTGLVMSGLFAGSGNAGWGLNAHGSGNVVELAGITPTITGALGEVTVDGTTDVTWAALSASGDYALDATTGARINRQ